MAVLEYSEPALFDLDDIWVYIAKGSRSNAERFTNELVETCRLLAAQPGMGRKRDDLKPGLRMFTHRRYVILYTEVEDGVFIERVLSGYPDIEGLFKE